jgi:phosphatidylglycerophosphate synthase
MDHRFAVMAQWKSLSRSIVLHGVLFFLAQAAVLISVTLAYGMDVPRLGLFLAISLVFHGFLTTVLLLRKEDFRVEATGFLLSRVNLANTLTYVRVSSIPTILFLVIEASDSPASLVVILPFTCAVFATDFLDGMTARRRGEITFVGRYLDSASDYLTIIAVTIVLNYHGLLPLWFLLLVLFRLVLFAVGMAVLALRAGKADPRSTFVGKVSVFALMVLYAMEVARLFSVPGIGNEQVVMVVMYTVAAIVVVSVVDKGIFLGKRFSELTSQGSAAAPAPGHGRAPRRRRAPRADGSG